MSADPFIQAPDNLQSYNRYSYVINNPMTLSDPTGFNWLGDVMNFMDRVMSFNAAVHVPWDTKNTFESTFKFLQSGDGAAVKSAAITFASGFCGPYAPACNGAGQAALASAYGASDEDALKLGAKAALEKYAGGKGFSSRLIVGCVSSVAGGGTCGDGAKSAAFQYWRDSVAGPNEVFNAIGRAAVSCLGASASSGQCENAARISFAGDVGKMANDHADSFTGGLDRVLSKAGIAAWQAELTGKDAFSAAYLAGRNELGFQLDTKYGFSKYGNEIANRILNCGRLDVANVVQITSTWVGTKDYSVYLPQVGSEKVNDQNAGWIKDARDKIKSKLPL
jgi:hypothetical protein